MAVVHRLAHRSGVIPTRYSWTLISLERRCAPWTALLSSGSAPDYAAARRQRAGPVPTAPLGTRSTGEDGRRREVLFEFGAKRSRRVHERQAGLGHPSQWSAGDGPAGAAGTGPAPALLAAGRRSRDRRLPHDRGTTSAPPASEPRAARPPAPSLPTGRHRPLQRVRLGEQIVQQEACGGDLRTAERRVRRARRQLSAATRAARAICQPPATVFYSTR